MKTRACRCRVSCWRLLGLWQLAAMSGRWSPVLAAAARDGRSTIFGMLCATAHLPKRSK